MTNLEYDFKLWIIDKLNQPCEIERLQGDASSRQYYRINAPKRAYIGMLAPLPEEKTQRFLEIAKSWQSCGLVTPKVYHSCLERGFAILSDFGDTLLLDRLNEQNVDEFYHQAFESIQILQQQSFVYPVFDQAFIRHELDIFAQWFVDSFCDFHPTQSQQKILDVVYEALINNCLEQPQVVIHRDFHSRNLMILPDAKMGILDFQDAMLGPVTYDLVSLLKDCYIRWPNEKVRQWAIEFYRQLPLSRRATTRERFLKWLDWTGLQRHLKVLGVFSRLKLRDDKTRYLSDIPLVMQYVFEVCDQYPQLSDFHQLLRDELWPQAIHALQKFNVPLLTEVA